MRQAERAERAHMAFTDLAPRNLKVSDQLKRRPDDINAKELKQIGKKSSRQVAANLTR
jgi:hypothetical protein